MKKAVAQLFFLISVIYANAQSPIIKGLVLADDRRVENAMIDNLHHHTKAESNYLGQFTIVAAGGDSLVFFKTNYLPDTVVVTDQKDIVVRLIKKPTVLPQVNIHSTTISPSDIYNQNKKDYKDIYFNGDKSHMIVFTFFGPAIDITKLNNALGKKGRDARRLQRTFDGDYKNLTVDKRFDHVAALITGFKGKQLANFIVDNRPSFAVLVKLSDYDLCRYIKKKMANADLANSNSRQDNLR